MSVAPPRRTFASLFRILRWPALVLLVLGVLFAIFVIRPFWNIASRFEKITFQQPSRLYGLPSTVVAGQKFPVERLIEDLRAEGYREAEGGALPAGRYRRFPEGVAVHLRYFPTPDGQRGGGVLEVAYKVNRVTEIHLNGKSVQEATLQPPLLASYYGADLLERRPVKVADVSEDLIDCVLAAEDDSFFSHAGLSPTGILRALWKDVRGGDFRQGGSTLTQQLVKNLFLTQERKVTRKLQELVLAVMIDARYSKREILEAYLNEIYMGGSGGVNLMGMGAAARAYFGKDSSQLTLAEAATLAGMIRAPAYYSPILHPDHAKERRDFVLHRLEKLGHTEPARIAQALASPISVASEPLVRRRAPYFADAVQGEAERRFQVEDLADGGYTLFATLSWRDQQAAQESVDNGLAAAEKTYEKGNKKGLQAALISIEPKTGAILAYVGGRRYDQSQFDRVSQAFRQSGSSFKPIVYAAAFENKVTTPAAFLEDEPLTVQLGGQSWSPKNDDGTFHGLITVRSALEHSYNPATARLALQVGIPKIVKLAKGLGITSAMEPFPSTALGASAIAPIELGTVYASLANGGVRPPVHALVSILDAHGKALAAADLPEPERVLSRETTFIVTSLLQGVLERGTGRNADAALRGDLAGKTGTTNDRRDTWFAGYSPERATVVWVGYDDNSPTRLSGARAALPIWSRFTTSVAPPGGYATFPQPPGVTTAVIDPGTGLLATEFCPVVFTEVFREGEAPSELCDRNHSFAEADQAGPPNLTAGDRAAYERGERGDRPAVEEREREKEKDHPFRRWLRRIFGGRDEGDKRREEDRNRGRKDDGRGERDEPPPRPPSLR
ncbi:MAG TPA: PBP1A family penicillin-binding protein [Thermoanaerobaculia bacterium]